MSTFPNSPKLIKGGIVLIDPQSAQIRRIISLQYNPDSLSRTLQVQGTGESGDRSEALRLKGPAVETIKLDAEIDATDQLEFPEQNRTAFENGIQPQLALLESLVQPSSEQLSSNNQLAQSGVLEIAPMESALALFVWSKQRIVPVRVTDFSVTEEAFDPALNPIRAKVSLGMRVLSVDDLGFQHRGGSLFLGYLQNKEQLAAKVAAGSFATLGIGGIP
ncbi:MAG TPA: hypothetical protein VF208_02475 [Candidatus Binatia bacterium]